MAKYLPLPDGSSVTIREGETPQQAWARAQRMYPEAFAPKEEAAPTPEPTIGGQVKEFFKGIPAGAIGLLESAAIGASALLPDETEAAARRTIADVAGAAKKPFAAAPGYEETIPRKLGEAAGSTGPFLAAGPFGLAGRVGAAALGAGAGAGEARTRAEREGGEEAKGAATALGTVVGLSEMFAPMRILGRLEEPVKAGAVAAIRRALVAGGEEAAQETASQIAQNLIAKGLYKPDQSIIEQVGESAAYGGATGAMIQGLLDLAVGRRAKGAAPAQDAIQRMHAEEEARKEAERARRETPEYALDFGKKYQAMQAEYTQLRSQLKRPGPDATAEDFAVYKEQQDALTELQKQLRKDTPEYRRIKPLYQQELEKAKQAEEAAAAQKQAEAERAAIKQPTLPGFEAAAPAPEVEDTEAVSLKFSQQQQEIKGLLDDNQQAQSDALEKGDFDLRRKLAGQRTALQAELEFINTQLKRVGVYSDAASKAQKVAEQLDKARSDLRAMSGPGFDPDVADKLDTKIRKLEEELAQYGGAPQALPLGKPVREQAVETKPSFAARVYKPGAPDIEAQEAALQEEQAMADEATRAEALREQKVAPEILALRRIAERPAGVDTGVRAAIAAVEEPSVPGGSSAMGQMQQQLRGVPLGEDLIYTAEETPPTPPAAPRRVPSDRFRLFNAKGELQRPSDYQNLSQRLASALARKDLTDDAYDFLRRVENVLPTMDFSLSETRVAMDPTGIKRDLAQTEGMLTLLDQQLSEIERGAEGRVREGAPRQVEYQRFPAQAAASTAAPTEGLPIDIKKRATATPEQGGKAAVDVTQPKTTERTEVAAQEVPASKRVTEITPRTLRGPGAKAQPLSMQAEIEPLLQTLEQARQAPAPEQTALFPEEEKKLGFIKPTREAFVQFMNSPFVRTLRKKIKDKLEAVSKAKSALPALRQKIVALNNKITAMQAAQEKVQTAQAVLKEQKLLIETTETSNQIGKALTDMVVSRMSLRGDISELETEIRQAKVESEQWGQWGKKASAPMFESLNNKIEQLKELQKELAGLEDYLQWANQTIRVLKANNTLAEMEGKTPTQAEVDAAITELRDAQKAAGVAETTISKDRIERLQAEAEQRRVKEGVAETERREKIAERQKEKQREGQRRLEAMYGDEATGLQYSAIEEARRMVQEGNTPSESYADLVPEGKEPKQVLGGIRSLIASIEKRLQQSQASSKTARLQELDPLQKRLDALEKAYKEERSAEKRAKLIPQIDAVNKAIRETRVRIETQPLTWKGMKRDIRDLAQAYAREEMLSNAIAEGKVATEEEKAPKQYRVKPSKGEKQAVKETEATAESKEAATRAGAPKTSGEALTKSQVEKLRKQKKTVYSSKGAGAEVQAKTAEEVRTRELQRIAVVEKAKDVTEKLKAAFGGKLNADKLEVLGMHQLPEALRDQIPADSRGFVHKGKAYLIADNISPDAGLAVLLHEVGVHIGFRNIFSAQQIKTLADNVRNWAKRTDDSIEARIGKAAMERVEAAKTPKSQINDELIAYAAENAVQMGVEPAGIVGGSAVKNWLLAVFNALKKAIKKFGLDPQSLSANDLVNMAFGAAQMEMRGGWPAAQNMLAEELGEDIRPVGQARKILFSREPRYLTPELERAGKTADRFIAKNQSLWNKIKANSTGLAFETQLVDRFAGFERLAKYMESLRGTQMMYYLRMYDQRMNFTSQAVARGAPKIVEKKRPDGRVERVIEAQDGASIKRTVDVLKDATPLVGNAEGVNRLFTMYLSAIRAKDKGIATLNFKEEISQADLDAAVAAVERTPGLKKIFDNARAEYNKYNRDLISFLASSGFISEQTAADLVKNDDYIPWYRNRGGVVDLVIGNESPIRIGDIKHTPYLQELVGGDKPILDFMTSSVQNTSMIMDMALNNLATKNAVYELANLQAAKFVKAAQGPDVVRFKEDGKDKFAVLATEKVKIGNQTFDTGVPADVLVKGMEGIPTQLPFVMRALAMPAQLLRKGVTLSPLYMARQLFRDSLAAPIMTGADFTPVFGALRHLKSEAKETLEKRGITGGQQFVGRTEDISMILRDITSGKPGWMQALGKFEAAAMESDALTRRAQYNSYIEQGMSEMEATLMALESMNFNKRGASPSVHYANALIPFFNAQIQGLNVLYKAATGKLPFNDKLKIRRKMLERGSLMVAATLAYVAMMDDDEAYKNATPDQKYGNWFVRLPGVDEPLRIPVPFEIGYIFKALPEALYNSMKGDKDAEDAFAAFRTILRQTIPGGSSYGIPQALKPAIEVGLGKSFYTGRDILSAREKELLPEEQFRANTTDLSKALGRSLGISPINFEYLVNGYTGTLGLALMQALSVGAPASEGPEAAVKRLSEYPVVGGAFQPNDAGGIINNVYERFNDAIKVRNAYKKMVEEGRTSDANALLERRSNEIMAGEMGDHFKNDMNKITAAERAIQAADMSPTEKRKQLDEMRKLKTTLAQTYRTLYDQTISYSSSL